jgi:arsenate reductase
MIRNSGEEPLIVEYLKTPPTRDQLIDLMTRAGLTPRALLRRKGTPYDELGLDDPALTDDQLIDAMMAHPILINRPLVVTPLGVKLCRPSEIVLDILSSPQQGAFVKEDGEVVIDANGRRQVGSKAQGANVSSPKFCTVLFLCTGNSARSILAESILNRAGQGRFKAYSAGSQPAGRVNPHAIALLQRLNYPTETLRSKSWEEFAAPSPIVLDFVFTVCDNAAGEVCPVWPGQPMSAHWGVPDPAAVAGTTAEIAAAFAYTYRMLETRISIFVSLPLASLDRLTLQKRLDAIGRSEDAPAATTA